MDHSELKLRPVNRADAEILGEMGRLFCQHAGWTTSTAAAVRDFWGATGRTPPADLPNHAQLHQLGYVHQLNPWLDQHHAVSHQPRRVE